MKKISQGFSITELIVAIAIMGIAVSLAAPNFQRLIQDARVATQTNEFVAFLSFARSEAIKRGMRVTLCKVNAGDFTRCDTSGSWSQGWIVFVDGGDAFASSPSTFTPSSGLIFKMHESLGNLTLTSADSILTRYVSFERNGLFHPESFTGGAFKLCPGVAGLKGRTIAINSVGRVSVGATPADCP
ncbi:MAG: GspH/FimT family pseudopilin [Candidatus Methylumidiphilus sp.]